MTAGIDLAMLSHSKDHLILSLIERLDTALARIAELEKRLAASVLHGPGLWRCSVD